MKIRFIIILLLLLISTPVNAQSNCSTKEQTIIKKDISNININYEFTSETMQFEDMDSESFLFEITILNITKNNYIKVTNDFNSESKIYSYADSTDGVITFKWYDIEQVVNFKFEIYSSNNTSCPDELFRTISLKLPRYNYLYDYEICDEYKDFYLCKQLVFFNEVEENYFNEQLQKYINKIATKKEENNVENTNNSVKDYDNNLFTYFITIIAIVIIIILIFLIKKIVKIVKANIERKNYEKKM